MERNGKRTLFVAALIGCLLLCSLASAGPYVPITNPATPLPSSLVPGPRQVPGKEYSNNVDRQGNPAHTASPEQCIAWDGQGGTKNTFNYSGSRAANYNDSELRQVDAMANMEDILFPEVIANQAALIFSVDADAQIYYEAVSGASAVWATAAQVDQVAPDDVDAVEVWGPDESDDADRYSLIGDPVVDPANGQRVAVFAYASGTNTSSSDFFVNELALAVSALAGLGTEDEAQLIREMDVDAMMVSLTSIMWSIDPITLQSGAVFDGGEIFTWTRGAGAAAYLNHGGHVWNTAFSVTGTFNLANENINALEAISNQSTIPEPATAALFAVGLLGLVGARRLRRRRT